MAIWVKISDEEGGIYAASPTPDPLLAKSLNEIDAEIATAESNLTVTQGALANRDWLKETAEETMEVLSDLQNKVQQYQDEIAQLQSYKAGILSGKEV